MSIITISRGSYCHGKEVAEKVAEKLGYTCVSRDILLEASSQLNVPEIKLVRALYDAPSILDRMTGGKEKFMSDIRAALLNHLKQDNIVYHGLAGHFFLRELPNVLKVRILADMDQRAADEAEREGIPKEKARQQLQKDDEERRQWSLHLYGIDTWDPNLYDMVFNIGTLTVDCVVNHIVSTIQEPRFQTTEATRKRLDDYALAADIHARLDDNKVEEVVVKDGQVCVKARTSMLGKHFLKSKIKKVTKSIPRVRSLELLFQPKKS